MNGQTIPCSEQPLSFAAQDPPRQPGVKGFRGISSRRQERAPVRYSTIP